jgi:CRP-like cAMP-binding protein
MKPFEKLFTVLMAVYPLSDVLKEFLSQRVKMLKFKKNHILLRPGETADYIYFISTGMLRAYYTDEKGKEQTFWLMKELDMMASAFSFFTRQPGDLTIEVLEDCELIAIDYDTLEQVYKEFIEFNVIGRVLTQKYYALSDERAMILRMTDRSDRYWYWYDRYSELENRVKQKYIASYLGMRGETLSRAKKKKRKH